MATFTYAPSYSSSADFQPRIKDAKLGDGYELGLEDGINVNPSKWNLSFSNISVGTSNSIMEFFETNKTWINSFDWTNPRGVAGKYKCRSYKDGFDSFGTRTVSATFEQVYQ